MDSRVVSHATSKIERNPFAERAFSTSGDDKVRDSSALRRILGNFSPRVPLPTGRPRFQGNTDVFLIEVHELGGPKSKKHYDLGQVRWEIL